MSATPSSSRGGTKSKSEQLRCASVFSGGSQVEDELNPFTEANKICRALSARLQKSPVFLQRSLSYMRDRMSRSHQSRRGFKVVSLSRYGRKTEGKEACGYGFQTKTSSVVESPASPQQQCKPICVLYRLIHNDYLQTESRDDLRCPWCFINCLHLYSLMKHLKLCHPMFCFRYEQMPTWVEVNVSMSDSFDLGFDTVPQPPTNAIRKGPTKRREASSVLVCRPKSLMKELFDIDEEIVEERKSYITGHDRSRFNSTDPLPGHLRNIDVAYMGERVPEWLRVKTARMVDEYSDVNSGEKELMKLWNNHVMHYNYVGDCQVPQACKRFVEFHGRELIKKKLYNNFCLHIVNLCDFGLVTRREVHETIEMLHAQMRR